MNDYELRRAAQIQANQALLAELDIKPVVAATKSPRTTVDKTSQAPAPKRRKLEQPQTAPSRTSARIAAAPAKPTYNNEPDSKAVSLPRSTPTNKKKAAQDFNPAMEPAPLVPTKDVESLRAGWTAWKPTAPPPTRDQDDGTFHFADFPDFLPNKSPEEMLREGCFGGSYYRPLRSRKLGIIIQDDWKADLPASWTSGLDVGRYLTSEVYDADVNKFKVACGQSIEAWEAAGWIVHEYDVRGWFQWYVRFWVGRRCADDARQVGRWRKCVGFSGRWRRMLLKRYWVRGVREVFDDGEAEAEGEVSPVVHQTCLHWAWEVRQGVLDAFWAGEGG
ncbi:hypothetical protein EJ03DRAFT_338493 [Teratosphaeria nubilosa]|uniref:Vegetatible incompatibility protein HET-E-1 n=1 Tax=Teratosphaeria nubilosa TaxID=161662 RepID=A0A6G1KZV8_9PEZI|nr:hypothetical protein EJ03DRAFT_338493 [Teratosphaeria nubilosa]